MTEQPPRVEGLIRVTPHPRRWGWRAWVQEWPHSRVDEELRLYGLTLTLWRADVSLLWAERKHWRARPWWKAPVMWAHRGAQMAEFRWWRISVFVDVDPVSAELVR